jgi:hypothetical protein
MASKANFQGLRHLEYRKVSNTTDKGHRSTIQDLSQDYAGSFNVSEVIESRFINRTNAITEVKKYDEPHVTIYQQGEPDNADPANLNYVISILNDGNRRLGPIYVRDLFPAGADLSSTSIGVSSSDSDYADWVFNDLPIGGSITIYLQVRIDSVIDPSINRVYATASYDGTSVSATSSVITNANWLGCSPDGERL